jgi:hypothetical protein
VTLDTRRVGEGIFGSAVDLARVWRAGRASSRPAAFPGLIDGIVESFLSTAGEALAAGRGPALVWPATTGVVRIDTRDPDRGDEELDAEWDLVAEVLEAALRALDADDDAIEWAGRATVLARAGTRALPSGGPPGVLAVHLHSDPAAMRLARTGGSW